MSNADRLGIEHQTVFGLPPVEFVHLTADLDCRYIAIGLTGGPYNPHGYEPYSLRDDASLRRKMVTAMQQRGVSISLGEGFVLRPQVEMASFAADLDVMAELGVTRVNTVSMDPDVPRTLDSFGLLVEMASARGMETTIEFVPSLTIRDLDGALTALRHVDRPEFRLLIDTMHLVRSGHTASDLGAIDPALIAHVQLSDHTISQQGELYREDTMDRRVPGEGEFPLREILAVVPPDVVIGLEVPMRSRAEEGESSEMRSRRCVEAARNFLDREREVTQP
jgi:sugar phosphate isomerase/epimerase